MVESLAGERLYGGSQRLQVPGLKVNKGDKRETVASFMERTVWGNGKKAPGIGGGMRQGEALSTLKTSGKPGAYAAQS